jgi:small GTP-binding protein
LKVSDPSALSPEGVGAHFQFFVTNGYDKPMALSPKVVLLGSAFVGKTSISHALQKNAFEQYRPQTIGCAECTICQCLDGQNVEFRLFDTAGDEKYRSITVKFFREVVGGILVFSLRDQRSFDDIKEWHQSLSDHSNPSFLILVGNMSDVPRVVSLPQAEELARELSALYLETSARTGSGIEALMTAILQGVSKCAWACYETKGVKESFPKPATEPQACC